MGTSTTSSYHSTGLNPSTKYYFKVAAVDNAGNIGALSSEKSGVTGDAPSLNIKSRSETAVTFNDNNKENPNPITPPPDDIQGTAKVDKSTSNDAVEPDTRDESPSTDSPRQRHHLLLLETMPIN